MSNFIYNSIFTNYALNQITKNLAELGVNIATMKYGLGSGVSIKHLDPSNSDFSGLTMTPVNVIYNKDDTDKNNYNIILSIDPNETQIRFNQVGIFDDQNFILGFINLDEYVLVNDLREEVTNTTLGNTIEYRLYININAKTGNIRVYDKNNNTLGNGHTLYGFVSVKLGQGINDLDTTKTEMSSTIYTLDVNSISYNENSVIITAMIPEELKGIAITEIGLFENFYPDEKWIERNQHITTRPKLKSHMFFYSKVDVFKPEDLGYFLKIQLNLKLNIVRFEGLPNIKINQYKYAVRADLYELQKVFLYMEANLERIISNNGQEIGYNLPQVYYADLIKLSDQLYSIGYGNKCSQIVESFDENAKDLYFMDNQRFSEFKALNLLKDDSYIKINTLQSNKFISYNDSITFNEGAISIAFTGKLNSINNNGIILTKDDENGGIYFNLLLEGDEELGHQIKFIIMSSPNAMGFTYNLDDSDYKNYMISNYLSYIITFNGSFSNPEFNLYIDGKLQEIDILPGNASTLNDLSSFSLTNYRKDIINNTADRYLGTWSCITGLAVYSTVELPYFDYKKGDYYVVYEVSGVNYKPPEGINMDGTRAKSTVSESQSVYVGDLYVYDGSIWNLVKKSPMHITRLATFSSVIDESEAYKLNNNLQAIS